MLRSTPGVTSQPIILTPVNDTTLEVTETATLTLTPSATYNINAASDEASVTIQDDDSPVLSITAVPTAIVEGTGASTVILSLTNVGGGCACFGSRGGE
ncbi:MAG: hypothetical protein HC925_07955 [Coleofasciculaceae cyanobacterium SM2_3_26]|nr:hypothetical protein [Coleofasciculaceae cyanobacterium SM2_3_26]